MKKSEYYIRIREEFEAAYDIYVDADYSEETYRVVRKLAALLRSLADYRNNFETV